MIGNPPFVGGNRLVATLGEDYVSRMCSVYAGTFFSRALGRLIAVDSDSHVWWLAVRGLAGVSRGCWAGGQGILDIFSRAGGTPLACRAGRR